LLACSIEKKSNLKLGFLKQQNFHFSFVVFASLIAQYNRIRLKILERDYKTFHPTNKISIHGIQIFIPQEM